MGAGSSHWWQISIQVFLFHGHNCDSFKFNRIKLFAWKDIHNILPTQANFAEYVTDVGNILRWKSTH